MPGQSCSRGSWLLTSSSSGRRSGWASNRASRRSSWNSKGQGLYYGKVGGCIITGNEDGIKHCAMDILYALQHIGFTIPPQADCGWIGEAGPGPSYGDTSWHGEELTTPAGFDNEFTNRNTTYMAWNLMHMAKLLKEQGGIPAKGNTSDGWKQVSNATILGLESGGADARRSVAPRRPLRLRRRRRIERGSCGGGRGAGRAERGLGRVARAPDRAAARARRA